LNKRGGGFRALLTNGLSAASGKGEEKFMSKAVSLVIVIMCALVSVSAQDRIARRYHSEDKNVELRADKAETAGVARVAEDFVPATSYSYSGDDFKPGVVRVGPRTTYLKEGLTTAEVVRLLGKPISTSERTEDDVIVKTYEFQRGNGRILIAEFEQGLLVRSRIEERDGPIAEVDF
jgi:hypothetical protein